MKMSRPDLVVPYLKKETRDQMYPFIITTAIILLIILIIISSNIKEVG